MLAHINLWLGFRSPQGWVFWAVWRLVRLVLLFLVLLLVALIAIAASLNAERGRLFWLQQTLELLPREQLVILVDDVRWPTWGNIEVGQALITRFDKPLVEVTGAHVSINLRALWQQRRLQVYELSAQKIALHVPQSNPNKPKKPSKLDLKIPQLPEIRVDHLAVEQLTLRGIPWPKGVGPKVLSLEGQTVINGLRPLELVLTVTEQGHSAPLIWLNGSSETATDVTLIGRVQQRAGAWLGQWLQLPSEQTVALGFEGNLQQQGDNMVLRLKHATAPLLGHQVRIEGEATLQLRDKTLWVPRLELQVDQQTHHLSGQVTPQQLAVKADINQLNVDFLRLWLPALDKGSVTANGELSWDWQRDHLPQGKVVVDSALVYQQMPFTLKTSVALTDAQINVANFYAQMDETELKLKGHVNTTGTASALTFTLTHFYDQPLRQLLPARFAAKIPANLSVHIQQLGGLIRGNIRDPKLIADLNMLGKYGAFPFRVFGSAAVNLRQLTIDSLTAEVDDATLSLEGLLDWTGNKTQLSGSINQLSPALAYQYKLPIPKGIEGAVTANWQISGPLRAPLLKVDGGFNGAYNYKGNVIPFLVRVDADTQIGKLDTLKINVNTLDVATFDHPVLEIKGYMGATDNDIKIIAKRLPTKVLNVLGYAVGDGRAEARLHLRGSVAKPALGGYISYGETLSLRNDKGQLKKVPLIWHANISSEQKDLLIDSSFTLDNQSYGQVAISFPWHNYLQYALEHTGGSLPMSGHLKSQLDVTVLQLFVDTDQTELRGQVDMDLSLAGTAAAPLLNGEIMFKDGFLRVARTGTVLNDIQLYASAEGERINLLTAFARDGEGGSLNATGYIDWRDIANPQAVNINLVAKEAHIIETPNVKGALDGSLALVGGMTGMDISGKLDLSPLEINIDSTPAASIPQLKVKEIFNDDDDKKTKKSTFPDINLAVIIEVAHRAFIRGRGLTAELAGKISIKGTTKKPKVVGNFKTLRGQLKLLKKPINVSEGRALFSNDAFTFSIPATYKAKDTDIKINVSGDNRTIKLELSAIPELPQEEILSRLLFGDSVANITPLEAMSLASSINTLSKGSGFNVLDITRDKLGIDSLSIGQDDAENGGGVNVGVGKYLNERVFLEVEHSSNPAEPWQGNIKIDLTDDISLESSTLGTGKTSGSLQWRRDY